MTEILFIAIILFALIISGPTIYSDYRKHHPKLAAH